MAELREGENVIGERKGRVEPNAPIPCVNEVEN